MHEVSLIEGVVGLIEDLQRLEKFVRVRTVRLRVGALCQAEPEALRFCFDAVVRGTVAEGARLEIEMVPGEGRCAACRSTMSLEERFAACPGCGSIAVDLVAGAELRLAEMEVE